MLTVTLYFVNAAILTALAVKSYFAYRRSANNFIAKSFITISTLNALAFLASIASIFAGLAGIVSISTVSNSLSTVLFFLAMMGGVSLSGRLSDKKILARSIIAVLVVAGIYVVWSGLQQSSITLQNQNGVITYAGEATSSSSLVGLVFSLSILLAYLWTSLIFIWTGYKKSKIRTKLYLLGGGFLGSTISGAALVYSTHNLTQYLIVYSLFFLSYVVIFLGVIEPSEA